jgi:hypothetical protein
MGKAIHNRPQRDRVTYSALSHGSNRGAAITIVVTPAAA